MAPLRLAIAIVLALAASAAADTHAHSYAYVTGVRTSYETSADGARGNYCDITARLPHDILKDRPSNDDRSVLSGAQLVGEHIRDPDRACGSFVHTWQPVDFDPANREDVHFQQPYAPRDIGDKLIESIFLLIILFAVADPIRYRLRLRRRANRRYRD
jgi:hypothetical protein